MPIVVYSCKAPRFGRGVFVAPTASVIGDVVIAEGANIWYGAVLRGDVECITVGCRTSVQDNAVVHADPGFPVDIGPETIVGHLANVHGAVVGERCLIGMGSTLLNGCRIGAECIVAVGALVTQGSVFPDRSLIMGSPARVVRELTDHDLAPRLAYTARYAERARIYNEQGLGTDLSAYRP